MPRIRTLAACVLLAPAALGWAAADALAQPEQSPAELRAENDRLREEIDKLKSDLDEKDREIERKDRLIEQLRDAVKKARAGAGGGGEESGDSGATEETAPAREEAPVPDAPFASPDSTLRDLQKQYESQFGSPDLSDQRVRQQHVRDLRAWARDASRNATGSIEWRVRVVELGEDKGSAIDATVEMFDAQANLPFGEPFTLKITGRNVARARDGGVGAVWIVDGVLRTDIRIDENALDASSAADGAFIGPCAVFTFEVALRSLRDV